MIYGFHNQKLLTTKGFQPKKYNINIIFYTKQDNHIVQLFDHAIIQLFIITVMNGSFMYDDILIYPIGEEYLDECEYQSNREKRSIKGTDIHLS